MCVNDVYNFIYRIYKFLNLVWLGRSGENHILSFGQATIPKNKKRIKIRIGKVLPFFLFWVLLKSLYRLTGLCLYGIFLYRDKRSQNNRTAIPNSSQFPHRMCEEWNNFTSVPFSAHFIFCKYHFILFYLYFVCWCYLGVRMFVFVGKKRKICLMKIWWLKIKKIRKFDLIEKMSLAVSALKA